MAWQLSMLRYLQTSGWSSVSTGWMSSHKPTDCQTSVRFSILTTLLNVPFSTFAVTQVVADLLSAAPLNERRRIKKLLSYLKHTHYHYNDVIMDTMACQITSLTIVYSTMYSGSDQRKHQSSASLAFVRGIHRWPVNSLHKGPLTRKMFPFNDVIMTKRWPNRRHVFVQWINSTNISNYLSDAL